MIDNKYFYFDYYKQSPFVKMSMDWFTLKPNLKLYHKSSYSFHFRLSFFKYHINLEIKWGHIERPLNDREKDRLERARRYFDENY